jgi:hypothetical protein
MTAARFDALLRTTATRGTSRRGLLKGMAGAALAGGGALVATSSSAASRCEDRQRQICKDYFAKGDPLTLCQQRGLTQGQCINECTAERTALKCS